jgi:hypothetical protein
MAEENTPTEGQPADPVERLRRTLKPARVVAVLRDGGRQELAIGGRRQRWDAIRRALDALDWIRLECYDSAGALIDVVESEPEPETEPGPAETTAVPAGADRETALVALMIRAQESVLDRIAPILDANARTLAVVTERLERAEARIDATIERDLATAEAAAAGSGDGASPEADPNAGLVAAILPSVVQALMNRGAAPALAAPAAAVKPPDPGVGG